MKKLISRFESPVEFAFLFLIFATALCFFVGSFGFTGRAWIFPRFTSIATMICVAAYSAKCLMKKTDKQEETRMSEEEKADNRKSRRDIAVTTVFFVAYLVITWLSGFLISSILIGILYPLLMGYRNFRSIMICLMSNVFFVLFFQKLMGISLTRGILLDLTPFFF